MIRSLDHAQSIKVLLEHGAEINAKQNNGNTALHIAAEKGIP